MLPRKISGCKRSYPSSCEHEKSLKLLIYLELSSFAVICVALFGSYVFSHTTSRIDVELGARLFRHLVQLPLAYFQARRVGDSVARVRELENIRSFLTGNALTWCWMSLFSVVFVAVMLVLQRAADPDRAGRACRCTSA